MRSRVSHEFYLSTATRYLQPGWSESQNKAVYGEEFSREGMGYNYAIRVWLEVDAGKWSDLVSVVRAIKADLDHKRLYDLECFSKQVPTVENLVVYIRKQYASRYEQAGFKLCKVRVAEGRHAQAELDLGNEKTSKQTVNYSREYKVNCLHRHHNPDLTDDENKQLYGKCSRIHGHEYQFTVGLSGVADSETGLVVNRAQMDELVNGTVVEPLNQSYFNDIIGNTSGEIICNKIHALLQAKVPSHLNLELSVRETRKNSFRWVQN